jgi:AraC family transcriptional regulator
LQLTNDAVHQQRSGRKWCLGPSAAFPGRRILRRNPATAFSALSNVAEGSTDSALTWQAVGQDATVGSFAIYPAGVECAAQIKESVDALIVAIDPDRLTLGAAENSALGARLTERLSGYGEALFDLARTLALEGVADYPNGRHYWNDVASSFIDGLVARHTSASATAPRGMLSKAALERLTEYIFAHLDEPIEVAELAQTVGRSSFHFCRVFSRSVGMSPHRYVVVRDGRFGFAEIAARTGFADQSHLSRWIRRVHGVSLKEIARPLMRDQNSKNLHDLVGAVERAVSRKEERREVEEG